MKDWTKNPQEVVFVLCRDMRGWDNFVLELKDVIKTDAVRRVAWTKNEMFVAVTSEQQLLGMRGKRFIVMGNFYEHPSAHELLKLAYTRTISL